MGKPKFPYTTVFLLLPLLFSCIFADRSEKIPLAKVGDEILYMSELESVLPNNLSREDSILMAEDYIKKWVTTELLIKKAHENLTMAQRERNDLNSLESSANKTQTKCNNKLLNGHPIIT